ncbi:hypothetical protein QYS48_30860 [Marivirga arenosa]|uniref:Glycosyltransferase n=1 Tax=Marivirga arenosa TaxID=3059076 RepID=A0AA51N887_9BACT|nr:hypothetical protein [Marivirga sp. ABR2-2]WMN08052.1 hypothetical protein QYS48_30860 [Marivirga sp. ABR2-2]
MILYIVPNINKVSGGPRSRIMNFKKEFISNSDLVIEGNGFDKLKSVFGTRRHGKVYIETASNRLFFVDFICLSILYLKGCKIIPFIRDIYIELLPQEYSSFRGKITKLFNKISNKFLCKIAELVVFPTKEMGKKYFEINQFSKPIRYDELPPGCFKTNEEKNMPAASVSKEKTGLAFIGGVNYANSGIDNFINIAGKLNVKYNFYILSQDKNVEKILEQHNLTLKITFTHVKFELLATYFQDNNIKFAIHARSRSLYDDLTFPIKILDLISLGIPFLSEKHKPIARLTGDKYPLFCEIEKVEEIDKKLSQYEQESYYGKLLDDIRLLRERNLYKQRYIELTKFFKN